jgi:addiction module HigA family antidote
MAKLKNIHPGEVLLEEFLIPFNISAYKLAKDLDIPQTRVSQILKGNRRITADTALRLSKYFGNSPKFWLGLQDDYDLEEEQSLGDISKTIKTLGEVIDRLHETIIKPGTRRASSTGGTTIIEVYKPKTPSVVKGTAHPKNESTKKAMVRSK